MAGKTKNKEQDDAALFDSVYQRLEEIGVDDAYINNIRTLIDVGTEQAVPASVVMETTTDTDSEEPDAAEEPDA